MNIDEYPDHPTISTASTRSNKIAKLRNKNNKFAIDAGGTLTVAQAHDENPLSTENTGGQDPATYEHHSASFNNANQSFFIQEETGSISVNAINSIIKKGICQITLPIQNILEINRRSCSHENFSLTMYNAEQDKKTLQRYKAYLKNQTVLTRVSPHSIHKINEG